MNSGRETILGRIREALASPSVPGLHHPIDPPPLFRDVLPPSDATFHGRVEQFATHARNLRADFHLCRNVAAAINRFRDLATQEGWKKVATHRGSLTAALLPGLPASIKVCSADAGFDPAALAECHAALTECECLIAQTGSVCVTPLTAGGRAPSVLPDHHVVVARREQLLPDLPAAFERFSARPPAELPSFIGFITGPSRTGDIERILVLGAHGPRRLTILLLEDETVADG